MVREGRVRRAFGRRARPILRATTKCLCDVSRLVTFPDPREVTCNVVLEGWPGFTKSVGRAGCCAECFIGASHLNLETLRTEAVSVC